MYYTMWAFHLFQAIFMNWNKGPLQFSLWATLITLTNFPHSCCSVEFWFQLYLYSGKLLLWLCRTNLQCSRNSSWNFWYITLPESAYLSILNMIWIVVNLQYCMKLFFLYPINQGVCKLLQGSESKDFLGLWAIRFLCNLFTLMYLVTLTNQICVNVLTVIVNQKWMGKAMF